MLAVQSWKTTREEAEVDGPGGRMEEDGLSAAVLYSSSLLFLKHSFKKNKREIWEDLHTWLCTTFLKT
jgi:hypothetical protein